MGYKEVKEIKKIKDIEKRKQRYREFKEKLLQQYKERYDVMDHSRLDYLTGVICKIFRTKVEGVRGRFNFREYVEARQTIMYLANQEKFQLWHIGFYFDGRDHTTVIHANETVEGTLKTQRDYMKKFNEVNLIIYGEQVDKEEKIETIKELNTFN
jgi:chromosomal replication initiation ATPase DnaA